MAEIASQRERYGPMLQGRFAIERHSAALSATPSIALQLAQDLSLAYHDACADIDESAHHTIIATSDTPATCSLLADLRASSITQSR